MNTSNATNELVRQFAKQRERFLRDALVEAKKWCVEPEAKVYRKRSDQFWLDLFSSSGDLSGEQVRSFMYGFQLQRRKWDYKAIVKQIMGLRRAVLRDPAAAVCKFADELSKCITAGSIQQSTSAASKVSFFTRPDAEIHIWDRLASRSACYRDWQRNGDYMPNLGRMFTCCGKHDYASYHRSCARALKEDRREADFSNTLRMFRKCLKKTNGPMSSRGVFESSFPDRRLLDKLMFVEGLWLEDELKR
jgi:hypothetical protein